MEPFAGSAGYSLRYPNRRVVLCDLDPYIVDVWRYLLRVSESEILALPDLCLGQTINDLHVCQEARWLIGFWLNKGAASPRQRPSAWMRQGLRPGAFWGKRVRETIAKQLKAVRHWEIINASYREISNRTATWFVDPPYEVAGSHYRFGSNNLDYEQLAQWCAERDGQVIVCENAHATWLPFVVADCAKTTRRGRHSREAIWTHEKVPR